MYTIPNQAQGSWLCNISVQSWPSETCRSSKQQYCFAQITKNNNIIMIEVHNLQWYTFHRNINIKSVCEACGLVSVA